MGNLSGVLAQAVLMANKAFIEDGCLPCTLVIGWNELSQVILIPLKFTNQEEKMTMLTLTRAALAAYDVNKYAVISEAWSGNGGNGGAYLPPSEDPDRKEILMVLAVSLQEVDSEIYEIVREKGKPPSLKEFSYDKLKMGGTFCDFLSDNKLPLSLKKIIKENVKHLVEVKDENMDLN